MPIPNIYELSRKTYDPRIEEERMLDEMYKRPFSPDEWDNVPDQIKSRFGGYVRYLQAYQGRKNEVEGRTASYEQARSGTLEVPEYRMRFGEALPASKRGIASKMAGASTSGIPEYRVRKDIRGNVSYEPIGVRGIHRTTEGQLIPESIEEVQAEEQLKYAIPKAKVESELELLTKEAALAQAKVSERTPKALIEERKMAERERKLGFEERRVAVSEQREKRQKEQFYKQEDFRKARDVAEREFKREQLQAAVKARKELAIFNADERKVLVKINNEDDLNRAVKLLDKKIAYYSGRDEANRLEDLRQHYLDMEERLNLIKANKSQEEFDLNRENWNKAMLVAKTGMAGAQAQTTSIPNFPSEKAARDAGYKAGDIVSINGRKARLN